MATHAKGLPASVQHFLHAGDRLEDVPHNPPHPPLAAGAAFRNDASSSHSAGARDFAAFHEAQAAQLGDLAFDRAWVGAGASTAAPHRADTGLSLHAGPSNDTARAGAPDGAELADLLSAGGLLDAVDGDWEQELLARQSESWRVELETAMPQDPFASTSAQNDSKGKARALESAAAMRQGDMSPTTTELLSSLSSLDLADKAYLRTLLSQDPDTVFDDYFARGSYTDDVYGLPSSVKRLFEKAAKTDERIGTEEGRKKALRRLGMVLRHMQATDPVGAVQQQAQRMSLSDGGATQVTEVSAAAMAQQAPLQRQQPSFAHAHHAPLFASPAAAQSQHELTQLFQPAVTTSSGEYTVQSSLSESAFITITPPPPSPPVPLLSQPAPPAVTSSPAAAPGHAWDTPAPSTAALLAHHAARLRNSGEGRFGPGWARAVPGREGEILSPLRTVEEPWDVKEGRTH